ncbi:hypothetical protein DFJ73DRAFT_923037, partial [Zopfochytrium polystomum]
GFRGEGVAAWHGWRSRSSLCPSAVSVIGRGCQTMHTGGGGRPSDNEREAHTRRNRKKAEATNQMESIFATRVLLYRVARARRHPGGIGHRHPQSQSTMRSTSQKIQQSPDQDLRDMKRCFRGAVEDSGGGWVGGSVGSILFVVFACNNAKPGAEGGEVGHMVQGGRQRL